MVYLGNPNRQRGSLTKGQNRPNKMGQIELKFMEMVNFYCWIFRLCPRSLVPNIAKSKNLVKITIFLLWNSQISHEAQRCSKCIKLIDWLFMVSRIFHLYGDVTITGEGLQNLGLCSALRAFEQGGIFIVPHLLWHGASFFPVSSEGPPYSVASYDTWGDVEDLF
jgi:hypothetical protein